MRAQGGLQTHCLCPSTMVVAQGHLFQSGPVVLGFTLLCPAMAMWEPRWWFRGSRRVPVPSMGSPVPHTSLQALGKLQTTSPQCRGCQ